jgi:hypothetical protein
VAGFGALELSRVAPASAYCWSHTCRS